MNDTIFKNEHTHTMIGNIWIFALLVSFKSNPQMVQCSFVATNMPTFIKGITFFWRWWTHLFITSLRKQQEVQMYDGNFSHYILQLTQCVFDNLGSVPKVKSKLSSTYTCICLAPHIPHLGTIWGWAVSFIPQLLTPKERTPGTHLMEGWWAPEAVWYLKNRKNPLPPPGM